MNISSYQLILEPLEAIIFHNTQWLLSMDPYLEVDYLNKKLQSQVNYKGGKNPKWKDRLILQVSRNHQIFMLRLWDHQRFKQHDLIAQKEINFSQVFQHSETDKWYDLEYEGKLGAKVRLKMIIKRTQHNPSNCNIQSLMDQRNQKQTKTNIAKINEQKTNMFGQENKNQVKNKKNFTAEQMDKLLD